MVQKISKDQALYCMGHEEFGSEMLTAANKVAIILTQSWCPEWQAMMRFIPGLADCTIYILEYDKTDYFDDFRTFKEETFENFQIPYIRYYENGKLIDESNAVSKEAFCQKLGLPFDGKGDEGKLDFLPSV